MQVYVDVEPDDVLDEMSVEELQAVISRRERKINPQSIDNQARLRNLLATACHDLRGRCESQAMRDYFYEVLGKIV